MDTSLRKHRETKKSRLVLVFENLRAKCRQNPVKSGKNNTLFFLKNIQVSFSKNLQGRLHNVNLISASTGRPIKPCLEDSYHFQN